MKVVCVGLNYVDHAREVELAIPERPLLFAKWQSAVIASGEPVVIPAGVEPAVGFEVQSPTGGGCEVRFEEIRFEVGRLRDLRDGS